MKKERGELMNLKVFSLIAVFLICILAVNGLTEDDKGKIKDGLERYGNDSAKMGLLINTLNVGEDLSDENELRNEIVEKAAASGVNENYYNNIKEGKAPEAVLKLQEAKAEDAKIEEMVEA